LAQVMLRSRTFLVLNRGIVPISYCTDVMKSDSGSVLRGASQASDCNSEYIESFSQCLTNLIMRSLKIEIPHSRLGSRLAHSQPRLIVNRYRRPYLSSNEAKSWSCARLKFAKGQEILTTLLSRRMADSTFDGEFDADGSSF
jgi:hypothetical protein